MLALAAVKASLSGRAVVVNRHRAKAGEGEDEGDCCGEDATRDEVRCAALDHVTTFASCIVISARQPNMRGKVLFSRSTSKQLRAHEPQATNYCDMFTLETFMIRLDHI